LRSLLFTRGGFFSLEVVKEFWNLFEICSFLSEEMKGFFGGGNEEMIFFLLFGRERRRFFGKDKERFFLKKEKRGL